MQKKPSVIDLSVFRTTHLSSHCSRLFDLTVEAKGSANCVSVFANLMYLDRRSNNNLPFELLMEVKRITIFAINHEECRMSQV